MRRLGIFAATIIALSPLVASGPAPLVSASREVESTIQIALVDTHYPASLESEADALAGDVNRERAKRGISQLTRDVSLDRFAHAKAVDMAARGYFGHTSPEGITFAERMRSGRWPTAYVGENIAFDRDEPAAHQAFLNSAPHLTNVIDPNERRIGVAVVTVGHNQTFYVEDFSQ